MGAGVVVVGAPVVVGVVGVVEGTVVVVGVVVVVGTVVLVAVESVVVVEGVVVVVVGLVGKKSVVVVVEIVVGLVEKKSVVLVVEGVVGKSGKGVSSSGKSDEVVRIFSTAPHPAIQNTQNELQMNTIAKSTNVDDDNDDSPL